MFRKRLLGRTLTAASVSIISIAPMVGYIILPEENAYVKLISNRIQERIQRIEEDKWYQGTNTPKRIILVRHGETCNCDEIHLENNKQKIKCKETPEMKKSITDNGKIQSLKLGLALREIIGDETVTFISSPFNCCTETYRYIKGSFSPTTSSYFVDLNLRNQDFGNWLLHSRDQKQKEFLEAKEKNLNPFYFRYTRGEAAVDVYDRASSICELLYRKMNTPNSPENFVLITHSVFITVFLLRWFRWDTKFFTTIQKINTGNIIVLEKQEDGSYELASPLDFDDGNHPKGYKKLSKNPLPDKEKQLRKQLKNKT